MPEGTDRTTLLESIIAEGDRRKRRRWLAGGGGALVVVLAIVALAWPSGDREAVLTAGDPTTTTEVQATSTSVTTLDTSTTVGLETTTTAGVVDEPAPTTTEAPPVCRNSYDPRCGEFYWDYDPATFPNAPLEITVEVQPAQPSVGEDVTITFTYFDADIEQAANCAGPSRLDPTTYVDLGQSTFSCSLPSCALPTGPPRTGPWDPPPPPGSSGPQSRSYVVRFEAPGTYAGTAEGRSQIFCSFDGYDSVASVPFEITVLPA